MICPRCGNEWDAIKGPCPQCGFITRIANFSEQSNFPGSFQSKGVYPDAVLNSQPREWTTGAETTRDDFLLSRSQSGSLLRSHSGSLARNTLKESFSKQTQSNRTSGLLALQPGTRLRSGRYILQEKLEQQTWFSGLSETNWIGRDFQYKGESVVLCEVVVPDPQSMATKTMLRNGTHSLVSVGKNPTIPALKDAFNDQGRIFFVFDAIEGETLQARLQRLGHSLAEHETIAFCLQVCEILELLARQTPPLVHGLICPEHIYFSPGTPQCALSSFSPIIAGGVTQLIRELTSARSLLYTAPEFTQGTIDIRSDLYALIATAYYAVTGSVPVNSRGEIPHARYLNAAISPDFDTLLAKGLHPVLQQRYQHPSELRRDLLAIRSHVTTGNLAGYNPVSTPISAFRASENAAPSPFRQGMATLGSSYPLPIKPNISDEEKENVLLPSPETLPQMSEGHDLLEAALMLTVVLLGFGIATILGSLHP